MLTNYVCYLSDFCLAQVIHMIVVILFLLRDLALFFPVFYAFYVSRRWAIVIWQKTKQCYGVSFLAPPLLPPPPRQVLFSTYPERGSRS